MDIDSFLSLFTRQGQFALEAAVAHDPREKDFLGDFSMLAKRYPRETARAALETAILRLEAEKKFPQAEAMFFTREALEQATPWAVSSYRVQRYAGAAHIYDLGCSVGGDTLALAGQAPTTGIELDGLRVQLARANATALRVPADFIQADISALPLRFPTDAALFFDPARRTDGKRAFSVADYTPPLAIIQIWLRHNSTLGVKVSPGVDLSELAAYDCEIEFISLDGDLKEAMLWFGRFKTAGKRATLLPGGETLIAETQPKLEISVPKDFIYEPDPAILRAGLVEALGGMLDAAQLDPEIAYLTADTAQATPFARCWAVEDWMPFSLKRLKGLLESQGVGLVTVKKRGSPLEPEQLIQDLKLTGDKAEARTLFLSHHAGEHIVVIAGGTPLVFDQQGS